MNLNRLEFWTKILDMAGNQGLSQPMLADRLNLSLDTLKSWIYRGRLPPIETALSLASLFNVSLDWLCGNSCKSIDVSAEALKVAQKYDDATDQIKNGIRVLLDLQ